MDGTPGNGSCIIFCCSCAPLCAARLPFSSHGWGRAFGALSLRFRREGGVGERHAAARGEHEGAALRIASGARRGAEGDFGISERRAVARAEENCPTVRMAAGACGAEGDGGRNERRAAAREEKDGTAGRIASGARRGTE